MDVSCRLVSVAFGGCLLEIAGEIDVVTAPVLRAGLASALDTRPPGSTVVLDLVGVRFLAAAGVRVLLQERQAAAVRGVEVLLGPISPAVDVVLGAAGARSEFPVADPA